MASHNFQDTSLVKSQHTANFESVHTDDPPAPGSKSCLGWMHCGGHCNPQSPSTHKLQRELLPPWVHQLTNGLLALQHRCQGTSAQVVNALLHSD